MQRNVPSVVRHWFEVLASLVYPDVCQCCGAERAGLKQGYVGERCRKSVHLIQAPMCERCGLPYDGAITTEFECANCQNVPLHFTYARSVVAARGIVLDVIHRYKYHKALWFERFLVELLLTAATPAISSGAWNVIVPVPLHVSREREREFNQAKNLAYQLGKATGLPVNARALMRTQATQTQTHLSRQERAENVRNAFSARTGEVVRGARVVLVDDVLTTGATTNACARTLRKAGAEEVCVWTVARGLLS
jgi:competence protein ComFC